MAGVCVLAALLLEAVAQEAPKKGPSKSEPGQGEFSRTRHALTLAGVKLEYEATAGKLPLKAEDGKVRAEIFFVAYTKLSAEGGTRPVTFAFNGGPGSSSVWLHLGAFGPRRVVLAEGGTGLAPPYRLVPNDATLLDLTDLVFIDPVMTGYSRAAQGQDAKQFYGVEEDIRSVASFIREYTTRFRRWDSPKFLAGESYGTTRAVGLAGHLQDQEGMNLNGLILLSTVLNFETLRFDDGNDLPYILFLPSYTATAWYHRKLPAELQQAELKSTLAEVERFAVEEYAPALLKGSALPAGDRHQMVRKLARYTGLSEDYVRRSDLRIESSRYCKELLLHERRTVGRYDSRFSGADFDAVNPQSEYDPSYVAVQGPFTALVNEYLRSDLKYETELPYNILTDRVQPWNYGNARNRYLNMATTLRRALTKNPSLRVFVANGLYDLATPSFATKFTFNHLGADRALAGQVTMEDYPAGHMMYIDPASREKLKKDLTQFVQTALRKSPEGIAAPSEVPTAPGSHLK
jgi:carboxypeptidase C (cathepsin A)